MKKEKVLAPQRSQRWRAGAKKNKSLKAQSTIKSGYTQIEIPWPLDLSKVTDFETEIINHAKFDL